MQQHDELLGPPIQDAVLRVPVVAAQFAKLALDLAAVRIS
jgi:hypothetical protein